MARKPNLPKSPKSASEPQGEEVIDPAEAALYREVDEELRKERMMAFWKRYGGWISGGALGLALVAAGFKGYQYWEEKRAQEAVQAYETALVKVEAGNIDGAVGDLSQITRDYPGAVGALAALSEAVLALEQGRTADAVALYRQVAGDPSVVAPYRDLARILAVSNGLDILDRSEIEAILAPLRSPRQNFQPLADELAAYAALKDGDRAMAEVLFTSILSNPRTGIEGRERVRGIMVSMGLGLAKGKTDTGADGDTPSGDTPGGEDSNADDSN